MPIISAIIMIESRPIERQAEFLDEVPADSLEEDVVALGAVFDASQQTHRRVGAYALVELHRVQILHGDPPENRPAEIEEQKKNG